MKFWFFYSLLPFVLCGTARSADWPMWRHDPGRTATTPQKLPAAPENLKLKWVHHLHPQQPAWNDTRLQFDKGHEPIVLGKRLFLSSSWDDSVTAFDTESGEQLWKFFTGGPVRFAPVGGKGRVMFGSDDGWFYCVKASDGSLVWKRKAVPGGRKVIGNGRLISVWPVRGGPVLRKDRVYFAAGVWPLEGVFIYCLNVENGEVIWRNDACSYLYGVAPHDAEAYGGIAPQGYLLIDGEDLVVPSSNAYPARIDLKTGKLKEFQLPAPGRLTGGWFASTPSALEAQKLRRRGLLFDNAVNTKRHEDKPRAEGMAKVRSTVRTAAHEIAFADFKTAEIKGTVHSVAVADGKVFASTVEGALYCFNAEGGGTVLDSRKVASRSSDPEAEKILKESGKNHGFGVILGIDGLTSGFLKTLVSQSEINWIVIGTGDSNIISSLRSELSRAVPTSRFHFISGDPSNFNMPKWFADILLVRTPEIEPETVFEAVRPHGGVLIAADGEISRKSGAVAGTTNYTGDWVESADELVRAPFGVQWYGDVTQHFKRSPQPKFVDGVMISQSKDWLDPSNRKNGLDYRLEEPMFTDVYTGREFSAEEVPVLRQSFANADLETVQPNQYRPPRQKDAWKPGQPRVGTRINPMTGEKEPRIFPKSYGCDGGVDYGHIYSMRSGTAAFYDKRDESGTINIAGPRSGCTNSIVPANGLLNLPYFYEGCTCSYPLPSGLALVSMPEEFEQWTSWGDVPVENLRGKIQRLGINFGAPGDRKTRDGTLWLDFPNIGGPSPQIEIETAPEKPETFYQHSVFEKANHGWPWVVASGARNLEAIRIGGFNPGRYELRLFSTVKETVSRLEVGVDGMVDLKFDSPTEVCGLEIIPVPES